MRKLLLALALIASPAYAITPVTAPPGVRVDVVEEQLCRDVGREVREHIRNIYASKKAFNVMWYRNSKNQMLAFDCFYRSETVQPYTINYYSVIYVADPAVIDAQILKEREDLKKSLKEKQDAFRNTGYL
jgi:hypothetical protein